MRQILRLIALAVVSASICGCLSIGSTNDGGPVRTSYPTYEKWW